MTPMTIQKSEKVREYLEQRMPAEEPAPSQDDVRREMGWDLIPENRQPGQRDDE